MSDDLLGPAEIAELLGFTRGTVYVMGSRGQLPEPDQVNASGKLWKQSTIKAWAVETGRQVREDT